MNKSESINELATALSTLQGEAVDAYKDCKAYGYNYADLSSVLEIARPLLSKHGMAVTQLCGACGDKITLETVLMHTSGQWVSEVLAFDLPEAPKDGKKKNSKAQDAGSVITYMRRYALAAVLGITQTDDDAALKPEPRKALITARTTKDVLEAINTHQISIEAIDKWLQRNNAGTLSEVSEEAGQKLVAHYRNLEEKLNHEQEQQRQHNE